MADIEQGTIDAAVDRVMELLRGSYCRLRARVGNMDSFSPGEKYDVHFKRAAEACVQRGIDPCKFMEILFRDVKPYPYIQMVGSKSAFDRFVDSSGDVMKSMLESYEIQLNVFKNSVARIGMLRTIREGKMGMNSLFIYLAACANGFAHEVKDLESGALAEYLTSSYYDDLYGTTIPEAFRVTKLRLQMKDKSDASTDTGV